MLGKFICSSVSLASGIALGREGPSVAVARDERARDGNHQALPWRAARRIHARAQVFGDDNERHHHQSDDGAYEERQEQQNFVFVFLEEIKIGPASYSQALFGTPRSRSCSRSY